MAAKQRGNGQGGQPKREPISRAEWVVAMVSAALVIAVLGYMTALAFTREQTPPSIEVVLERVVSTPHGFLAEVRAENRGGRTAAAVQIEGELHVPGSVSERSEATIDYLPPRAYRRAGLFFSGEPDTANLRLRAVGYRRP